MARVLVSAFSNVTFASKCYNDSFVEGFINALVRAGNDVFDMNLQGLVSLPDSICVSDEIEAMLVKEVLDFKPELIISFNNNLPSVKVLEKTDCPVLVYRADGCDFFSFKEEIKTYQDRYYFLNLNESVVYSLKEYFPFIEDNHFIDFGYVTDFKRQNIEQDINLSFLGTISNWTVELVDYITRQASNEKKDEFFRIFDKFRENVFLPLDYKFPDFTPSLPLETLLIFMMTTKERFAIISALTDLGLKIYGFKSWCNCGIYDYEILRAFNFDLCVTQEQSEKLFNRSKICLNLPSARATCGFSWRVPDILASQSVLLCNKKPDLQKLMKGYADLPMYESPAEAHELAVKLLQDDKWRQELSLASNKMIEDKCRFEDKFKNIQDALEVPMLIENHHGFFKEINRDSFGHISRVPKKVKGIKDRVRYKVWKKLDKKLRKRGII